MSMIVKIYQGVIRMATALDRIAADIAKIQTDISAISALLKQQATDPNGAQISALADQLDAAVASLDALATPQTPPGTGTASPSSTAQVTTQELTTDAPGTIQPPATPPSA